MLKTQNKQYYDGSDINHEEMVKKMREMGYEKFYSLEPKPQKPMSKLKWKIKCFIHRVKRRIENVIYYFSGSMEE